VYAGTVAAAWRAELLKPENNTYIEAACQEADDKMVKLSQHNSRRSSRCKTNKSANNAMQDLSVVDRIVRFDLSAGVVQVHLYAWTINIVALSAQDMVFAALDESISSQVRSAMSIRMWPLKFKFQNLICFCID
jgi:hypothetical protein